MTSLKAGRQVMIASDSDKIFDYFSALLTPPDFSSLVRAHSAGEAKQMLMHTPVDILIVDTPLPDEFGSEFAMDQTVTSMGVMLLVKGDLLDKVTYTVEESGVLAVGKPNSRQVFYSSVKLLAALSVRLQKMETKNKSLQEKMADIRAVNRAKWLLIDKMNMRESDAHYFIEKRAMDARIPRREVAESIIRTYDH